MLDVHILTLPEARSGWLKDAVRTTKEAADMAGFEVNVHVLPGIKGDLGAARKKGYSLGNAKWKTFVDDDDLVLPGAFAALRQYMDKDVVAVFPRENIWQNGKLHSFTYQGHHLCLYRADFLETIDFDSWKAMIDVAVRKEALKHPDGYLNVDDIVYTYRAYINSKARLLRNAMPEELERLRQLYG